MIGMGLLIRHDEVLTSACPVLTLSLWERVGGEAGNSNGMPFASVAAQACKPVCALQVRGSGSNFIRSGSIAFQANPHAGHLQPRATVCDFQSRPQPLFQDGRNLLKFILFAAN
jgi:hypothetical protein